MKIPYAVVIGSDHYNTLGVVRSLGENNIDIVLIITTTYRTFVEKSKYIKKYIKISENQDEILQAIICVLSQDDRKAVLFPLSDITAKVLDDNRLDFDDKAIVPNVGGRLSNLLNKYNMGNIAERSGMFIPKHIQVSTFSPNLKGWDIYPAIIKPLKSIDGSKADISVVYTEDELANVIKHLSSSGYEKVLIEQYIWGDGTHMIEIMGFVDKNKDVEIPCIVSKIREYPLKNGSTSYAELVKHHDGVYLDKIRSMVRNTGFFGIFDIELIYQEGKAYFIEMNFRNGAPAYGITLSGRNLAYEFYCNACGLQIKNTGEQKYGLMMCEHNDIKHVIDGSITYKQWRREYKMAEFKVFHSKNDPKPTRAYLFLLFIAYLKAGIRKFLMFFKGYK
jgi:D-aspartate ligase